MPVVAKLRFPRSAFALSALVAAALLGTAGIAPAQEGPPEQIPFEGGRFTITETEELDKRLDYDGQLLARNYVLFFDRFVELEGLKVALFAVGDGGNVCGAATLIAWRPEGGEIASDMVGEDCGAPPAAATANALYFVPTPLPGETRPVQAWSPERRVFVAGELAFVPQPGTGWSDLDPQAWSHIIEALDNEAVYTAAAALLGDGLTEVVTGLLTGGGTGTTALGVSYASGCVPHACGSANAFMAVDAKARKVYFAQQGDKPAPDAWPALRSWPAELRDVMLGELQP